MVRRSSYRPGTPSWADVASPDPEAARAFYGDLFGWTGEPATEPEAMGYTVFMLADAAVAGLGPTFGDMPPLWNTYVTVADVDETLTTTTEAGGQVLMEAMNVLDAGRMAVIADPSGAALSLWQPRSHIGAEVRMERNAMCWAELNTRDPEGAAAFFAKLFGWETHTVETPAGDGSTGMRYIQFLMDDLAVGGMIVMDEHWPAEVPPHWMVYFAVDDCDATAARVAELGGQVCVPPTDIPPGRFAVVNDPHGAVFSIIALSEQLAAALGEMYG